MITTKRSRGDKIAQTLETKSITTQLGKFIIVLRMVLLYPVLVSWNGEEFAFWEAVGVVVLATVSLCTFIFWDKVVTFAVRHPLAVSFDIFVSVLVMARTGSSSSYFLYLGATALLIGLLVEGLNRVILTGLLISGFLLIAVTNDSSSNVSGQQVLNDIVSAFIIVLFAILGARMRSLQAQVNTALQLATRNAREAALGEERSRIARELHDSTVKSLVGISLLSDTIRKQPDASPRLAQAIKIAAETAVDESRHLLSNLRSGTSANFEQHLRAHLDEIEVVHGVSVDLFMNECQVSAEYAHNLEKIITEAATNAAMHSGTDTVRVAFKQFGSRMQVTVTDYGEGFRVRQKKDGHIGLTSMRERATDIGGTLAISSTPGKGTIVLLDIGQEQGEAHVS